MNWGRGRITLFALMGALVLTVFGAIVVLKLEPPAQDRGVVTSGPVQPPSREPLIDLAPAPERLGDLPRTDTRVPPLIDLNAGAAPLSTRPVGRALALLQDYRRDTLDTPIFVLGEDGQLRTLDAARVVPPSDGQGNERSVIWAAALTPDGTRAVIPQRDRVVIVDLVRGKATDLRVPGFNESVRLVHGEIAVDRSDTVVTANPATGQVRGAPYSFQDLVSAPAATAADPVISLLAAQDNQPARVRFWPDSGEPVDVPVTGHAATAQWSSPGWAEGARVARAAYLPDRPESTVVLVVDVASGKTVRMLVVPCLPPHHPRQSCAEVSGWMDGANVLVITYGPEHRLLAWNIETGRLSVITQIAGWGGATWSSNLT